MKPTPGEAPPHGDDRPTASRRRSRRPAYPSKTGSATTARTILPAPGCLHLITFNADGQAQHIAANHRPPSSLMFFSQLLRETLAGTLARSTSSPARLAGHDRSSRRFWRGSRVSRRDQGGCELEGVRADLGRGRRAYASAKPAGRLLAVQTRPCAGSRAARTVPRYARCWPRCRSVALAESALSSVGCMSIDPTPCPWRAVRTPTVRM